MSKSADSDNGIRDCEQAERVVSEADDQKACASALESGHVEKRHIENPHSPIQEVGEQQSGNFGHRVHSEILQRAVLVVQFAQFEGRKASDEAECEPLLPLRCSRSQYSVAV